MSRHESEHWLTGTEGRQWLARAAELEGGLAARASRLRRHLSAAQAGAVLAQLDLRRRGREKFAAADKMFFTPLGLEQATDQWIAAHKASRFAGRTHRADLCTGIGGDLLALAAAGETSGVDRDPNCAAFAQANVRAVRGENCDVRVRVGAVAETDVRDCDAWHIDPDRRPRGRRTTRVELHEPSVDEIERLLRANPHAAVKLAPAAMLPEAWPAEAELEWISRGRECRQLVAWFGGLAGSPGLRRATRIDQANGATRSVVGVGEVEVPSATRIGRYVFEPDAAVLAAGLSGTLASEHRLAAIEPGIAYWTGDAAIADPLLAAFAVEEVLALDVKRVAALVRGRGIGRLEVKVRGVKLDPDELRRKLCPAGDDEATLLVARIAGRVTAILARRAAL